MDIRQIRYFVTIVEERQITSAAKKLNMAQPPLSQQLKIMETELQTKLFHRNGRKLELTEAGKILYKKGKKLLYDLEDTLAEVVETGSGLQGTLAIGSVASCIRYLPDKIRFFNKTYPNITFKIWEGDPFQLVELIHNRSIELAVIRTPIEMDNIMRMQIDEEPFVLIIPRSWEKSFQKSVRMKDIGKLPLLLLHRVKGHGAYEMVLNELKNHDLEPNIVVESFDVTILLSLVEAEIGVTILPKSATFAFPKDNITVLDINDSSLSTDISIIWLKDRSLSKVAERFIDLYRPPNGSF